MKVLVLTSLAALVALPAFAQDADNAPLELGRPNAQPIQVEKTLPPPTPPPSLAPPPGMQQPKKRVVKKAAPNGAAPVAGATSAPAPTTTAAPGISAAPSVAAPTTPAAPGAAPVAPVRKSRRRVAPVVAGGETVAQPAPSSGVRHPSYLNFRFANIWAIRNRTNSGSFIVGWDPVIIPWKRFNFGATLGVTEFESEQVTGLAAKSFTVFEYGAAMSYYASRVFLPELVIGAQTWNEPGKSGTHPLIAFNGNLLFRHRPFGVLDRAYVGFGSLQVSGGSTNLFRAGVGFRF